MANVVLVDPPGWQGAARGNRPFPNVGIGYLAAVLRERGHEVAVLDYNNEAHTPEDLVRLVGERRPALVGFSVKTATFKGTRTVARALKEAHPAVPVMVGGPHASLTGRRLLDEPWIDAVFRGEAEDVLPDVVERLPDLAALDGLPGVLTRHGSGCGVEASLLRDIDRLPFPDYSGFPRLVRDAIGEIYPLVTSRGCSYKCTFCSVPAISGRKLRRQSPESVLRELVHARETWGSSGFEIIDDLFNLDMRRCKAICRALIDSGLRFRWTCPNGLRADRIDAELAGLMAEAGCHKVMVGIESADPAVLESVKKGETLDEVEHGIRTFKAAGIEVGGFFIIGLPGDSYASEERSVEFARRLGVAAHFNMLVPYPGTELYEWAQRDARKLGDEEDGIHFADADTMQAVIETDEFPADERRRAYEMANTRLRYFHMLIPSRLGRLARLRRELELVWEHDRGALPTYLFERCWSSLRHRLRA